MIRRTIDAGDAMPRFYGLAWWQLQTRQVVCYPIPLNYIIARLRDWWIVLKFKGGRKYVTLHEASILAQRSYQSGYAEGKASMKPLKTRFDWPASKP